MKTSTDFAGLLEAFFTERLMNQRQASPHTIPIERRSLGVPEEPLLNGWKDVPDYAACSIFNSPPRWRKRRGYRGRASPRGIIATRPQFFSCALESISTRSVPGWVTFRSTQPTSTQKPIWRQKHVPWLPVNPKQGITE